MESGLAGNATLSYFTHHCSKAEKARVYVCMVLADSAKWGAGVFWSEFGWFIMRDDHDYC